MSGVIGCHVVVVRHDGMLVVMRDRSWVSVQYVVGTHPLEGNSKSCHGVSTLPSQAVIVDQTILQSNWVRLQMLLDNLFVFPRL